MPWYDYKCSKCDKIFEIESGMSDVKQEYPCESDGCNGTAYKIISSFNIGIGASGCDSPDLGLSDYVPVPGQIIEKKNFPDGLPKEFNDADAAFVTTVEDFVEAGKSSEQKRRVGYNSSANPNKN